LSKLFDGVKAIPRWRRDDLGIIHLADAVDEHDAETVRINELISP